MKYLLPGLLFLLVFQVFTIILTGYTSFTNYGTGHLDDQAAAINALEIRGERPVEGSADYPVVPVEKDGVVSMLVTFPEGTPSPGESFIGTAESLTPVPPADVQKTGEKVTEPPATRASTWERSAPTRTSTRNGRSCASRSTWTRARSCDRPESRWPRRCGPATCTTRPPTP